MAKKTKKTTAKQLLDTSKTGIERITELEAQAAELKRQSDLDAKKRADALAAEKAALEADTRTTRMAQLEAERESKALAARLGATVDTKTGFIDPKTVTNPFGIYGPQGAKTKISQGYRGTGKSRVFVITYADGSEDVTPAPDLSVTGDGFTDGSSTDDGATGGGSSAAAAAAAAALEAQRDAAEKAAAKKEAGQSAYTLLFEQFQQYGLGSLVEPLKQFIIEGLSPAEFTLRLRETDAYKKRFAANAQRIAKGLRALSEAEYIGIEDQYQNIMRQYGLPASYYTRGEMGRQEGFEKFIAGDVSAVELEDRIQTAQNRVINAAPEIAASLKQFYPDLSNGDILAYVLDPERAITDIKRKVTAAEIGGAATMAGLGTGVTRAEELARYGVTAEQARQGFQNVAEIAPRGGQLAEIYRTSPYTQTTAEQEVFGLAGSTEAARQRKRLTQLETAAFSGASGAAGGALGRERAGQF